MKCSNTLCKIHTRSWLFDIRAVKADVDATARGLLKIGGEGHKRGEGQQSEP